MILQMNSWMIIVSSLMSIVIYLCVKQEVKMLPKTVLITLIILNKEDFSPCICTWKEQEVCLCIWKQYLLNLSAFSQKAN